MNCSNPLYGILSIDLALRLLYMDDHVISRFPSVKPKPEDNPGAIHTESQIPFIQHKSKMSQPLNHQARSAYRALLREIPRKTPSTPTPLHRRLRAIFRSQEPSQSQPSSTTTSTTQPTTPSTGPTALPFSPPTTTEEMSLRIQEAEQVAQYARAQRNYAALLDRYNPGMHLDEEERIRLTARRVGLDLPELHQQGSEEGKRDGSE